ncbi:MAG: iron donor protein CyaY [Rickettsiaceae bacterium]|nr:iron donor protein CyaY [Rickettsiaceae bacterium]
MKVHDFVAIAKATIDDLVDVIEAINVKDEFDVDFRDEVLIIDNISGQFVINYHSVANQIWLSSPISGPHHFDYNPEDTLWKNRHGVELKSLLLKELS